jgi:hypothetical protein
LLLLANRFEQILAILAFAQALQAVLEAASYFVVRRKLPGKQFTPLHPVLPAAFVGANAALALWVAIEDPLRAAWGAGVIALASAGFLIAGRGRWYGAKARALESGR